MHKLLIDRNNKKHIVCSSEKCYLINNSFMVLNDIVNAIKLMAGTLLQPNQNSNAFSNNDKEVSRGGAEHTGGMRNGRTRIKYIEYSRLP